MRCEAVQRALSSSMDERAAPPPDAEAHSRACPRCSAFREGAWRLRQTARFEVAPPVPDLVPAIMERVAREREAPVGIPRLPVKPRRAPRFQRPAWRAVAVAAAIGMVAGFVITAGGIIPRKGPSTRALAAEIPHRLVQAAVSLEGYRATFEVTERNWAQAVPVRTFVARVAFRVPEDFRVDIRDTTRYPPGPWAPNDLSLVTDGRTWRAVGPEPCPTGTQPPCPGRVVAQETAKNRPPFDSETPMPTDVIVPMTVLAAEDRVDVIGPDRVGQRAAVAVRLSYQDATPLFAYLNFLGSWRPFFPQDKVVVSLDRETWFPLRYAVYPAAGAERAMWASLLGLPREPSGRPVFEAIVRSLSTESPPTSLFKTSGKAPSAAARSLLDEGFRDLPPGSPVPSSLRPVSTQGLRPVRFGEFPRTDVRPYREQVAAYARGLAWLTVTRVIDWPERRLFGVGAFAQRLALPGGHGIGYYEPATSTDARRLALHTNREQILLSSNLPLDALLRAAASLPVRARPEPALWRVHRWRGGVVEDGLAPATAARQMSFPVLVPTRLPHGYEAVSAQTVRTRNVEGLTMVFRRPAAELDGVGLELYQAQGQTLPPPTGAGQQEVRVRGVVGRWWPDGHRLEWVEGGIYRSLIGPSFDLTTMLGIADSLRPTRGVTR